ncbi:MAG: copper chaperone PCu(A)C [Burkholderiales bacterium]|nr:copper chaperone PCu(A)C [Burkholderiales bacterium]
MKTPAAHLAFAIAAALFSGALHAAEVTLANAWMRPAMARTASARVYVDIDSSVALELVGAATPVARSVQIVLVRNIDDPASEVVVKSLAIPVGTTTRLAYRGNHLRLTDINRDLGNGTPVPLTLTFKDAGGTAIRTTTHVVVRGLLPPRLMPDAAGDKARSPSALPAPSPAAPRM